MAKNGEARSTILGSISNNTKLLALIALIAEGFFIAALLKGGDGLDSTLVIVVAAIFLILIFLAIVYLEHLNHKKPISTSSLSEDDDRVLIFVDHLVKAALETVCRAVSLPNKPEQIGIRIFIFKKEGEDLICRFYWSETRVIEMIRGEGLRFKIDNKSAQEITVVKSVLSKELEEMYIEPLSEDLLDSELVRGDVESSLKYVLAIPIFKEDGTVWGIVDFDASTDIGVNTLRQPKSRETMLTLSQLLSKMFELEEEYRLIPTKEE